MRGCSAICSLDFDKIKPRRLQWPAWIVAFVIKHNKVLKLLKGLEHCTTVKKFFLNILIREGNS